MDAGQADSAALSPFVRYSRKEWCRLRTATPLSLSEADALQRTIQHVSLEKVSEVDYFDFSIYVDAAEKYIREWYLQRFLRLRDMALRDESAYMHRYASLSVEEATKAAERIWAEIDHPNLKDNIEPTKSRARLILEKRPDHSIRSVQLRKV